MPWDLHRRPILRTSRRNPLKVGKRSRGTIRTWESAGRAGGRSRGRERRPRTDRARLGSRGQRRARGGLRPGPVAKGQAAVSAVWPAHWGDTSSCPNTRNQRDDRALPAPLSCSLRCWPTARSATSRWRAPLGTQTLTKRRRRPSRNGALNQPDAATSPSRVAQNAGAVRAPVNDRICRVDPQWFGQAALRRAGRPLLAGQCRQRQRHHIRGDVYDESGDFVPLYQDDLKAIHIDGSPIGQVFSASDTIFR